MKPSVDVVVLTRTREPLRPEVARGLAAQNQVNLHVYRVVGNHNPSDRCRWEVIARARNQGKRLGESPWLMFLDDDVELGADCVRTLCKQLEDAPLYAAMAADYLGESRRSHTLGLPARHVAMGATLFRRLSLNRIRFRWEGHKCECQCCCDDLRRLGLAIDYCAKARARHLVGKRAATKGSSSFPRHASHEPRDSSPTILTAFNGRHAEAFERQFLASLRSAGNNDPVMAVAFDVDPAVQRRLGRLQNVHVRPCRSFRPVVPLMRVREFQRVLQDLPSEAPVAYWDAGDVIFQDRLAPLWESVERSAHRLLVAREPLSHPTDETIRSWTLRISDASARRSAFRLVAGRPCLNGGFAAGRASALLRYLRYADKLLNSRRLASTPGDQTALNLYCYANPESWSEAPQGWNYCLFRRRRDEYDIQPDGRIVHRDGTPIPVVHGNAGMFDLVFSSQRRQ